MVIFKEGVTPREFTMLDMRLKRIVLTIEQMAKWAFLDDLVVTSIVRNDGSTHSSKPPYRFIDIAVLNNGGMKGTERIRRAINELYVYDHARPKLQTIPELRHGTGPHMHCQCKPN